jgi:hypothetical protein
MLYAGEDAAYTYVFAEMVPALTIVISAVAGNSMAVKEPPKGIISETAYAALASAMAQAKNNLVDFMAA